ncbi:MAG: D-alanyl-D-alanine endopeptidase [gamma proteobacterium symbiont of Bathyaustriella thionipta]|nr:D-alanyl-D-alanine endopeptidase [gamma proteobacterium symbiont of Bathyaustriella thionipta]MCU7949610.1 D-alanyl-D-alanine endopeptidase [gamma proteobacterium symbiont of Bathyaustriella thionipta]MCU7953320.1 D-alanyl-D-alanine endopeptidase [gamma proteobacterium symbiont of Bathyaustriella thionipta]MCU7956202.1 D-alanyl-D-alanine endopeptidase [gamma proteobacterium symbiont of Bathyaustriella thionipta]MCU7968502.1 D-alanyl-D-alanine endopeptidase [gamma proteobacterium symbiont of 
MKKIIVKTLCFALLLSVLFSAAVQAASVQNKKAVNLASVSAIAVDSKTGSVLFAKNSDIVMPIASITKVMTAIVILDSKLSLKEKIRFAKEDKQSINNYFSRVRIDSELSRGDTLRIALMSSENLAASALGRSYPGGSKAFVKAMNAKAKALGMKNTHFVNSTGLSEKNVSTASDVAKMVAAAAKYPLIKKYSTTQTFTARFKKPRYILGYTNTNVLVRAGHKDVKLSKTGYLDEAGRCLIMLRRIGNKDVVMVMLDSFGKRSPIGDANRIKKWLKTGKQGKVAKSAANYEQMKLAQYSKDH